MSFFSNQNKRFIAYLCLLAVFLLGYRTLDQNSISFDLTQKAANSGWQMLANKDRTKISKNTSGFHINTDYDVYLISPNMPKQTRWVDLPFVKVEFEPTSQERELSLIWFFDPSSDQNRYSKSLVIAANTDSVVFDSQTVNMHLKKDAWDTDYPDEGEIKKFGLRTSQSFTLKNIKLTNTLSPFDHLRLFVKNMFFNEQPFHAYSINLEKGFRVGDYWFTGLLGIIWMISVGGYVLHKNKTWLLITIVFGLLAYDINLNLNLWRYAQYSQGISSFFVNEDEEYKSRFGEKFAKLNQVIRETIPNNDKILVLPSRLRPIRGESNWVEKLYTGLYVTLSKEPNFVIFYYPEQTFRLTKENNKQILHFKENQYSVRAFKKIAPEVMILKVVHD